MKILHISTIIEWRGGDQQMLTTYEILREFPEFTQLILCPETSVLSEKCKAAGIPYYTAARKSKFSPAFFKKIIEIIRKDNIDVVHVHDSTALTLCLGALRFAPPVKLVYSRKRSNRVKPGYFKNLKYSSSLISEIICNSEAVKDVLVPVVKNPERIKVIYDGIDLRKCSQFSNTNVLHREFKLDPDTLIIGNAGGLTKQKDHFTFLAAAKEILNSSNRKIAFVIIGEGPLKEELIAYCKELKVADKVYFAGFRKDLSALLPEFDMFLLSSESEGVPLTVLEAFAHKVPVVATAAGGTPEAVIHGESGMISPVKDPVALAQNALQVLGDVELREKIINHAFERAHEKFSLQVMQKEYHHFYNSLD